MAVHSLKDIPPACQWNDDLIIGAYLGPRETPQDVLITNLDTDGSVVVDSIQTLPRRARVGSASIRRQAQLLAIRSDLNIVNIRGNVDARLKASDNGEIDALILAMAGLKRLGLVNDGIHTIPKSISGKKDTGLYNCNTIPIEQMLPGCGQGVIGVTCRCDNKEILSLLQKVDDTDARIAATAERAFLDTVQVLSPWEGRPPVAGFMRPSEVEASSSTWLFDGLVTTPDGAKVLRVKDSLGCHQCNEETAQRIRSNVGEKNVKMAGDGFLDGYY